MTKRYSWWWSLWIGVVSGVFCCVYAMTPLAPEMIIFASFVALPIFFGTSGAEVKEFLSYTLCLICGILWAVAMLVLMRLLGSWGVSVPIQMLLVIGMLTFFAVAFHMVVLGNTVLNKVPMVFGGLAMTFFCSMYKGTSVVMLTYLTITMIGGLIMGICISVGGKWMQTLPYFKVTNSDTCNENE